MGFRLYKSVSLGKGVRINLSKTGVGVSAGIPGLRYSVHSSGRTTKTAGIPGTGVYYRKDARVGGSGGSRPQARTPQMPQVQMYPKAGLLAPKDEKLFVNGVTAYMQGRPQEALTILRDASVRDVGKAHVGEEFFEAMSLVGIERYEEAILPLEEVVASEQAIPDQLMLKYRVTGHLAIQITPIVLAEVPMSSLGAALMLAELYQRAGDSEKAIELLESLGSLQADVIFALSLAELYDEANRPDDVIRVTEGFSNADDASAQLLVYRAGALRKRGLNDAALAVLKEALKSRSRDSMILRIGRYLRGLVYEDMGKKTQARKDFERVYAEDSGFLDVCGPCPGKGSVHGLEPSSSSPSFPASVIARSRRMSQLAMRRFLETSVRQPAVTSCASSRPPATLRADVIRQFFERPVGQDMAELLMLLEEREWARAMIEELRRPA